MNPEDLDAELNKIWAKVASGPVEPAIPPSFFIEAETTHPSRGAAMDALRLFKRQYRDHKERWEKMLEVREEAVRTLSQTLNRAEAEIAELKRQNQRFEERLVTEVAAIVRKLEAAQSLLRLKEEKSAKEEKRLVEDLSRLDNENRKLQEQKKELSNELELINARLAKSREEREKFAQETEALNAAVNEAKSAMAGTLAELVAEKESREKAERELGDAKGRLSETGGRLARLEKLWEEERRQWQELLEREKSFRLP